MWESKKLKRQIKELEINIGSMKYKIRTNKKDGVLVEILEKEIKKRRREQYKLMLDLAELEGKPRPPRPKD